MQLEPNDIHIWLIDLAISDIDESLQIADLSQDERERADRFRAPIHRKRFIATRYALRKILSDYLSISTNIIRFNYNQYGKPSLDLADDQTVPIQFNITHSDDMALCALTLNHAIGIDIEKMIERSYLDIAKRFYSPQENQALAALPTHKQMAGFYRLWARKEALAKAIGKGLQFSLTDFSVSADAVTETIHAENKIWTVMSLDIPSDYQAALASDQTINNVLVWKF